jgi:hypothetical protein
MEQVGQQKWKKIQTRGLEKTEEQDRALPGLFPNQTKVVQGV